MAQTKTIQLLRSSQAYTDIEAAKTAIQGLQGERKDGEILLGRYWSGTGSDAVIKSVLAVYHAAPDLEGADITEGTTKGWTFIQDITSSSEGLQALQTEVNAIETALGFNGDGTKDNFSDTDALQIIAANDTIAAAVEKVAKALGALDKSADAVDGKVVTTVSQSNGLVSETKADLTDVKMGGYSKTNDTGAIAATDTLEVAVSKLENGIAATTVKSTDKTVAITNNSGKDLSVNIDGTTLVKDGTSGVISTTLSIYKYSEQETTAADSNAREIYQLQYGGNASKGTAIGEIIKVYKDSSLANVYLGHVDDKLSGEDSSTHESSSQTVVPGTGSEALCFVYQLANGNYKLQAVNVESFLMESEFKDGLTVNSLTHEVSVKIGDGLEFGSTADADGNKPINVKVDTAANGNEFLSVSANGLKVSGVSDAINNAIAELDADFDASGTASHNGTFVMSGVTEVDGVITAVDSVEVEAAGAAAAAKETIDTYTVNGKTISSSPSLDAGDINVDDSAGTPETVASAITRLENAATASKTVVAEGTDSGNNMTIDKTTDANGADTYTINLTGIAQDADVVKTVNGVSPTSNAVTIDGGDIALTGYAKGTAPENLDVAATDTVNAAIAKLEHQIDAAETASTNAINALDGNATATAAAANGDFSVLTKVSEVDGVVQSVGSGANDSKEVLLKKVAGTGAAEDVTITDSGNLITATNVETALQEIAGKANTALQSVSSGNGAISVGTKSNNDQTVSLVLDTTTESNNITSDMLQITSNGLMMKDTWDCGTF